ncbi:MAG: Fe-S protein assembly co-chaperone HscB [Gammaproteobacteria bacterium]|nr:Fe-S protein assembly co-chaperone HscB [Gammaproteobacteria bacterium]MCW9003776.1 Fe-S protein assembly co-chaperone HscB [Gammaproteobacteria bacterium]
MSVDLFSSNYFEIFNASFSYDIDLNEMGQIYLDLQKSVHPDRYANASDQEKRIAMQQTSLINQAFQTLKDPVSRAQYMLKLKGLDMNSETDTTMDAGFLMEQMEFRESIMDARDKNDPLAELDSMAIDLNNKMKDLMDGFTRAFAEASYDSAREIVRKMQFIIKAKKEVDELSEKLEDELM